MLTRRHRAARVAHRDIVIDGTRIAYREAGSPGAPAVLLLHGVPSSSRMYQGLLQRLGGAYHAIALDYPGFGNSDAPPPQDFTYDFEHLAHVVAGFTDALGLGRYTLFMQDYGAPVGMRLAIARPTSVQAIVVQNGNLYEEGLGPMWESRRGYWTDRAAHEEAIRTGHLSLAVTRARHIGADPDVAAYDPDLWNEELAYLHRPGIAELQLDLIHDYRTNIVSYPAWQAWLRTHQPPTLVLWGRYDLAFTVAGALAFKRDLPDAEIHILDAGHFAMDTRLDEVADLTCVFLDRLHAADP